MSVDTTDPGALVCCGHQWLPHSKCTHPCLTAFLAATRALPCPPHSLMAMLPRLNARVLMLSSTFNTYTNDVSCRNAREMFCWRAGACALLVSARWLRAHPHCNSDLFCFLTLCGTCCLHITQQADCTNGPAVRSRALGLRVACGM